VQQILVYIYLKGGNMRSWEWGPTNRAARTSGNLDIGMFYKKIQVCKVTKESLRLIGPSIEALAKLEGNKNHARQISVRIRTVA
jgi:histidinol dehydrogenase